MKKKISPAFWPVLFCFFIMGFCDVVGIASTHVKEDLLTNYSPAFKDTLSNLIAVSLFSMFLIFSIPTGLLMNRIGRKKTVMLSNLITVVAMAMPLLRYSFDVCLLAFALLGIANTMLQVSLNPLLTNVVSSDRLTSSLTAGQFVKAISSFCAPFLAALLATLLGKWQYMFPLYAIISLMATLWLLATPIDEKKSRSISVGFPGILQLFRNRNIWILFGGILFVVGVDVGMNTASSKILMERVHLSSITAGYGPSTYFAFRTLGTFLGIGLLAKYDHLKFYLLNICLSIVAIIVLFFVQGSVIIFILYAVIGFTIANIFPIIYSLALNDNQDKANEVSGLMITGVFGGAVIPFLMGLLSDKLGSQQGALLIILGSAFYLLFCVVYFIAKGNLKSVK